MKPLRSPKDERGDRESPRDDSREGRLSEAISELACVLCAGLEQRKAEFEWRKSHLDLATKQDLREMERNIMSAIGDWSAKVGPKLDRVQTGLDAVQALVEKLQNTPGALTPEDQALLDQIEQKVDAIAVDADSVPTPPPV